jgi:DNA-binding beta-propeller fold protein YncE
MMATNLASSRRWLRLFAGSLGLVLSAIPLLASYHVASRILVGGEGDWDYLEPDPGSRRLYVTHETHVVVIDMDTLKIVGDVPNCPGMGGVALAPELNRGFTANGDDDTVTVFALDSLKPLARWKATGRRPNQIVYEPFTHRVVTFNSTGRNATVFAADTGAVLATLPLDGRTEFAALDGRGMLYDSLQDRAAVVAIDARTLKVTATYSVAPDSQPAGTVMDPLTRRIFVGCRSRSLLVLNADSGKVVARYPLGERNDAVKFDPVTRLALASNGDGTLTILREDGPNEFTLEPVVLTEFGARTMAVDRVSHRIFMPTADFGPAPAPTKDQSHPRRAPIPGTFRVLVLEP